jgi:hypothetical protein
MRESNFSVLSSCAELLFPESRAGMGCPAICRSAQGLRVSLFRAVAMRWRFMHSRCNKRIKPSRSVEVPLSQSCSSFFTPDLDHCWPCRKTIPCTSRDDVDLSGGNRKRPARYYGTLTDGEKIHATKDWPVYPKRQAYRKMKPEWVCSLLNNRTSSFPMKRASSIRVRLVSLAKGSNLTDVFSLPGSSHALEAMKNVSKCKDGLYDLGTVTNNIGKILSNQANIMEQKHLHACKRHCQHMKRTIRRHDQQLYIYLNASSRRCLQSPGKRLLPEDLPEGLQSAKISPISTDNCVFNGESLYVTIGDLKFAR